MKIFSKIKEISLALVEESEISGLNNHFSFAVKNNRILKIARNSRRTSPRNLRNPKFSRENKDISGVKLCCSELNLFISVKNTTNIPFNRLVIVNTRVDRNRKFVLSRPCLSCSSLISYIGPRALWFTNNNGEFEKYGY